MTNSIVLQEQHLAELKAHLLRDPGREHAAFLLGGFARWEGGLKLLVREVVPVPKDGFVEQEDARLVIAPAFFNAIIKRAANERRSVILTHSHPLAIDSVHYSWVDDAGEPPMFENLYRRAPSQPHGSMVFGTNAVAARIWHPSGECEPVDRLVVVGARLEVLPLKGEIRQVDELHDRQARAFGADGQERLASVICAVVGAGGTGSITAEQLVRLGVRRLLVVDDDVVERSNVSRVYGSRAWDARWSVPKVAVLERLAEEIGIGTEVVAIKGTILDREVALRLREADVLFACTDSHWSRAILNQYAYQYLTPIVDMGNRIDAEDGTIRAANGRVYTLLPGKPCLWCCDAVRSEKVAEDALPVEDRQKLAAEGYVRGLDERDPSVISLNTVVSGLAVTEFLDLVTGFMGRGGTSPQLVYQMLTNTVTRAAYSQDPLCDCATGRVRAVGDLSSLPCRAEHVVS